MSTIREMLHRGNGMRYATKLNQIWSYYSISIKKKIQKLLTIIMPWGKCIYTIMLVVLSISAVIFQREMTKLMEGIDYILVYIDDLLVTTKSDFDDHLEKLQEVLLRLQEK